MLGVAKAEEVFGEEPYEVIQLNDDNFEHLTQAATGAMKGDWFVKFYTPWCGHCQAIAPTWAHLAMKIGKEVNVAELNIDECPNTAERFNIRGLPTLLLLRKGKFYKYTNKDRPLEALEAFTMGGYAKSKVQGNIPGELTTLDLALKIIRKTYYELIFGFETIFDVLGKGHLPWYIKIFITTVILFSPAIVLVICIYACENRYLARKQAQLQAQTQKDNTLSEKPSSNRRKQKID
ncbi:unnamed protein product [Moneuplotes crassus]|uniref:Thioredoxin domain-containing protein n=1 Tax=Euplotes crassus TaxID=5936 RepID=A0AAD1XWG6_EUPCR|nr:unnamed protein product [Moneuplotes crassus]